jgi:arginine exporter protein ArgO
MKEVLDIIVWGGFIFLLFIFLRGMNETQTQKHVDMLEKSEKQKEELEKEKNLEKEVNND